MTSYNEKALEFFTETGEKWKAEHSPSDPYDIKTLDEIDSFLIESISDLIERDKTFYKELVDKEQLSKREDHTP